MCKRERDDRLPICSRVRTYVPDLDTFLAIEKDYNKKRKINGYSVIRNQGRLQCKIFSFRYLPSWEIIRLYSSLSPSLFS